MTSRMRRSGRSSDCAASGAERARSANTERRIGFMGTENATGFSVFATRGVWSCAGPRAMGPGLTYPFAVPHQGGLTPGPCPGVVDAPGDTRTRVSVAQFMGTAVSDTRWRRGPLLALAVTDATRVSLRRDRQHASPRARTLRVRLHLQRRARRRPP